MNRLRITVMIVVLAVLCAGSLPLPSLADNHSLRPTAEEIPVQSLIIGSFIIHLNALSEDNFRSALDTVEETRQGMYYKSEFGENRWFKIDNATTQLDITMFKRGNMVDNAEIDNLFLAVWIDAEGNIINLLNYLQVQEQILKLMDKVKTLDEQIEAVAETGDNNQVAKMVTEKKSVEATIAFWMAIQENDTEKAAANLAVINNPDQILNELQKEAMQKLEEETQKLEEALQEAEANGEEEKAAEIREQLEQMSDMVEQIPAEAAEDPGVLEKKESQLAEALNAALAEGDADAAADAATEAVQISTRLRAQEQELDEEIDGLEKALDVTATSLSETRLDTKETVVEWVESTEPELLEEAFPELAGGEFPEPAGEEVSGLAEEIMQMLEENPDLLNELPSELVPPLTLEDSLQSIDTLTAMNENLNEQLTEALKEEKFLEKDVLEEMIASLPDQPAAQELGAVLEEERAAALEEIKQLTKSLYTEEELSALEQLAENISGELAASAEILPVESVITNARDFKLDFPAIIEPTVQFIRGRPVSELFGVTVVWDDRDMTAAFIDGANVIVVQIGSHTGYMNGRPFELKYPPRLIEGYTVVPVDFLSEKLNLDVNWNEIEQTIEIRI